MTSDGNKAEVVVVGAGIMGTGIAHAIATSGASVTLVDTDAASLEKSKATIGEILDGGVERNKLTRDEADDAFDRLATRGVLAEAIVKESTRLVIETVSESMPVKIAVAREVDELLAEDAVIATNTSALSVTEIAASTARADRFIGMHFFNPVHMMKLVELVKGLATTPETVAIAESWVDKMGKNSILVNESPGLTTSRMSALLGNEAMYMLAEGVASAEDIDAGMRGAFNHPMGPLELGDLTGWDTRLAVLEYLREQLGEKFRPCPLIVKMVKAGRTGRKCGQGVYRYENGKRVPGSGMRIS